MTNKLCFRIKCNIKTHKKAQLNRACCHEFFYRQDGRRSQGMEWDCSKPPQKPHSFNIRVWGQRAAGLGGAGVGPVCFNGGARCSPVKINAHPVVAFRPQRFPFLSRERMQGVTYYILQCLLVCKPLFVFYFWIWWSRCYETFWNQHRNTSLAQHRWEECCLKPELGSLKCKRQISAPQDSLWNVTMTSHIWDRVS